MVTARNSRRRAGAINFPRPETPTDRAAIQTYGFRVNGLWVVRAELPPRVPYAERKLLGQITLGLSLHRPEHQYLEPGMVNRDAHMWVCREAEAAGLQVVGYRAFPSRQESIAPPLSATANYVIAQANAEQLAQVQAAIPVSA